VVIRETPHQTKTHKIDKSTPQTPSQPPQTNFQKIEHYITTYSSIAVSEMEEFGIPASITLAQGILESSMGVGRLAREANNHFGIKCHSGWNGKRIYHDDDEKGECFRVYQTPKASFRDHSVFLNTRSRYAFLFETKPNDYKAWAKGLKKAGYATDPKYPEKLISLIERFGLDRFDGGVTPKSNKKTKWISQSYIVQKGDTLYSLAKRYNITVARIIKENNIKDNTIYLGQQLAIPIPLK